MMSREEFKALWLRLFMVGLAISAVGAAVTRRLETAIEYAVLAAIAATVGSVVIALTKLLAIEVRLHRLRKLQEVEKERSKKASNLFVE